MEMCDVTSVGPENVKPSKQKCRMSRNGVASIPELSLARSEHGAPLNTPKNPPHKGNQAMNKSPVMADPLMHTLEQSTLDSYSVFLFTGCHPGCTCLKTHVHDLNPNKKGDPQQRRSEKELFFANHTPEPGNNTRVHMLQN